MQYTASLYIQQNWLLLVRSGQAAEISDEGPKSEFNDLQCTGILNVGYKSVYSKKESISRENLSPNCKSSSQCYKSRDRKTS